MRNYLGVDVGYEYTKVVDDCGKALVFPSVIGNYVEAMKIGSGQQDNFLTVTVNGNKYFVGNDAIEQSERHYTARDKGWIESEAYAALLMSAISQIARPGFGMTLVTGLPVKYYQSDVVKERLVQVARKACIDLGYLPEAVKVVVLPQPFGTFFDMLINSSGGIADEELKQAKIGIIDIGSFTTDFATISGMKPVTKLMTSFENGCSTAYAQMAKDIENRFDLSLGEHERGRAVRKGYVVAYGEKKDITDIVENHYRLLAGEIAAQAKDLWKSGAGIERIILTGGGAIALAPYLSIFPHQTTISEAQIGNARGYHKYAFAVEG